MKKLELIETVLQAEKKIYLKPDDSIFAVTTKGQWTIPMERTLSGHHHFLIMIKPLKRPGQDYPLPLKEKYMQGRSVCWLLTNISASHSPATRKMLEKGIFLISNPNIKPDWPAFLDPRLKIICRQNGEKLLAAMGGDVAGLMHITAPDGTDLRLRVPRGNWRIEAGDREGPGTNGPFGELFTAPYWAQGTLILNPGDFMTNSINELKTKIRLEISKNRVRVIRIQNGQSPKFRMLLEVNNPLAMELGEFAFGLNPARPRKIYGSVTAEKMVGGFHVALGTNSVCLKADCPELEKFQYGRYTAGSHIDSIKFGATITFRPQDSQQSVTLIKDGKLAIS